MSIPPNPQSHSLEYESQAVVVAARAVALDRPTVEVLAVLVVTCASVALCSLSWWMALHT